MGTFSSSYLKSQEIKGGKEKGRKSLTMGELKKTNVYIWKIPHEKKKEQVRERDFYVEIRREERHFEGWFRKAAVMDVP